MKNTEDNMKITHNCWNLKGCLKGKNSTVKPSVFAFHNPDITFNPFSRILAYNVRNAQNKFYN